MAWELVTRRTGGSVATLTTVPTRGGALVLAATATGLFRSADGGRTWAATSPAAGPLFAEAVAVSPRFADDQTVFVGTRQGLYRSSDGGATWVCILVGSPMLALASGAEPAGGTALFVATEHDGILRSSDGGRSWSGANAGLVDLTVLALALSPRFVEDRTGFAATASGLYRTRNGGRAWRALELPLDEPAVQCLAVSPDFAHDRLVLAGTEGEGLLRSDDGGTRWELVPALAGQSVTSIAFSTRHPGNRAIVVATGAGLWRSDDGGVTWSHLGAELGPLLSLAFVPENGGEALLVGRARRGVARSEDGGRSWTEANAGLAGSLLTGLVAIGAAPTLVAASLDDGVLLSPDGGATWERGQGLDDVLVFGVAAGERALFASTSEGVFRGHDDGRHWELVCPAAAPPSIGALAVGRQADGAVPVLAASAQGTLLLSDDGGERWRVCRIAERAAVVSVALSPDYPSDRTLFVGTIADGAGVERELALWRSRDGGEQWEQRLSARGSEALPLLIVPNPSREAAIFIGVGGRVLRDCPAIAGGGAGDSGWREAPLGDGSLVVTHLVASPRYRSDGTLFAATSVGVYISCDRGRSFYSCSEGLNGRGVVVVTPSPRYAKDWLIYAAEPDGTLWRRRDAARTLPY